jgi:thiamine kinase-like enzyme
MSSLSLESDSILNSTGSCNHDSDSDTDADNDKKDNTNRCKKLHYLVKLLLIRRQYLRQRQPKCTPPRLVWIDFVSQLIQQNEFSVTFRMSLLAFNKLVEILRDDLEVHYHQGL